MSHSTDCLRSSPTHLSAAASTVVAPPVGNGPSSVFSTTGAGGNSNITNINVWGDFLACLPFEQLEEGKPIAVVIQTMTDSTAEGPATCARPVADEHLLQVFSIDTFVRPEKEDVYPFAFGDVSQIWKRQMEYNGRMDLLALVNCWVTLDHDNIMPFLGVAYGFGLIASLVMPLCPEGNINDYVKSHPYVDRLSLLSQVANGVDYLHSKGIVHGKIYGSNILITPDSCPLITDTGLSDVIRSQKGIFPWALPSESLRWQAPEVFMRDLHVGGACTASSDIWSLAMTILEVMSGQMPYYPQKRIQLVAHDIIDGILPRRPDDSTISESLWRVLNTLWVRSPFGRPNAAFVQWQLDALRTESLHFLSML
ncbi:hypothetical protein HWV62_13261 [Athelia sp. TMB]|nr:hypothetical protein HWV62_13261 [Athelia sp. TMB]